MDESRTGRQLRAGKRLRAGEQMSAGVGRATFVPDQAVMGGGGAPLSTGGDVAVRFSGFLAWYFWSSRCK